MTKKILRISGWVLFLLLLYIPVFQDIDRLPVQMWDESRNAVNAFEMTKNGNLLIRHYDGAPDMWELNPPLLTWLQSAGMMILGYNELALRIPISLAVLATIFLILHFFKTEFDTYWPGIISSLILVTSSGYIHSHIARTGDHDAVVILFLTGAALNYFKYLKYPEKRSLYLLYVTIFLILAVYTKSIVGLFALPGFLIYTLLKKQLVEVLTDYRTYVSFTAFIVIVGIYYFLREKYNPGYLEYVWNDQLFPRFSNNSENFNYSNDGPFYYVENLMKWRYKAWIFTLIIPYIIIKIKPNQAYKDAVNLFLSISLSLLFIISFGTKNYWYDGPVFPLFAMTSGIGLYLAHGLLFEKLEKLKVTLTIFLGLIIFYPHYEDIFDKVYKAKEENTFLFYGPFMKILRNEKLECKNYLISYNGYNAPANFYSKVFNSEYAYNTRLIGSELSSIRLNDTIMSCDFEMNELLEDKFELTPIESFGNCKLYVVQSMK